MVNKRYHVLLVIELEDTCVMCAELSDEVDAPDAEFPLWLVIVLFLAALLTFIFCVVAVLACITRRATSSSAVAKHGSAFVRMESGTGRWNLPSPERHVWTQSHLQRSVPPAPHTAVVNVPLVKPAF